MSNAPAISFIVLRCADIERSRAFYEATLGVVAREEQHGKGPRHYSFRLDGAILELYPRGEREIGGLRFGLRVVDLTATLASAQRAGGRIVRTASGDVSAVLEDPDGHKIELVQQHSSPVVHVDTSDIVDWDSFHNAVAPPVWVP